MRYILAALLLATVLPGRAPALHAQTARTDAYLDEQARELVRLARARRVVVDRRITAYETTARERISAGLRVGIAERLLWRRETVSRIAWTPDTARIELLGAREVLPPFRAGQQLPAGLGGSLPSLAFDPVDSELLLRMDSTFIRHPLSVGSEAHYRFSSGGRTVITLPDGRQVQLHELRISPRRADASLINGSFWIDEQSHGVVQAYFRLAGELRDESGGAIAVLPMPSPTGSIEYISIDYGLWDLRWWLPRTVVARGMMQIAGVRVPLEFERRYDDYTVVGDTSVAALTALAAADTAGVPVRRCRPTTTLTVSVTTAEPTDSAVQAAWQRRAARDSARAAERAQLPADSAAGDREACDRTYIISSAGRDALVGSDLFEADIYSDESALLSEAELDELMARVRSIAPAPWHVAAPRFELLGPGFIRYNRVEGLSLGGRGWMSLGRVELDADARIGTSGEYGAQAAVSHRGDRLHSRFGVYRRLEAVDVASGPFTLGSTVSTLLLGRDENDYFRGTGVEARLAPPSTQPQWYDLRLFGERQAAVATQAHFTLRRLADSDRELRPNVAADAADQFGARLRLRAAHGLDPAALRLAAELDLHGEAGDYRFVRPALRVHASRPLVSRLALALEAAAGTGFGTLPQQRIWQLGGVNTVRGYSAADLRGDTYWRARGELGAGYTAARVVLFGDAGWAGPRDALASGEAIRSVGVGLGLLDGLVRIDVARALDLRRGWKVHVQTGGR